jgi:drug/metabolite transporter (DMT)-like permease
MESGINSKTEAMMSSMRPAEWGMLILLSIFWGGSFFFVEIALRDFQPFTVVFLRVILAAIILLGVVYIRGQKMPASPKMWGAFFVMGALNNAIPFSLIVWGQTRIDSGVASIFNATTPIFTVLLAHLMTTDEKMTIRKLVGVLIGFLGVCIMMAPEIKDGFSWRGLGQIAVLGAAISYSFAGIFGKRLKNTSAVVNATGMLICSSIMMLPFAIIIDSPWTLKPSLDAMTAILGMATISTAVAYLLYFGILASAGATNVLLVTFLIPISALLLGVGVLGEVIRILEYTGMGCIFLGLILIDGRALNRTRKRLNFGPQTGYHLNIQKGKR